MPRIARIVVPGIPHHITQRGNRRQRTFFQEQDYHLYIKLMAKWCSHCGVDIWSYCLMPNHIHLIAVPQSVDSLCRAIGEAHRRYTSYVNVREGWRGYLWQGRFASFPLDERHCLAAARYVELNPLRAGLVVKPEEYKWSSAAAHLRSMDDVLVNVSPLLKMMPDWRGFLSEAVSSDEIKEFQKHGATGRPLGNEEFLMRLEFTLGRFIRERKRGPKDRLNGDTILNSSI